jgi:ABC-type multidrug transport system permease subunit
MISETQQPKNSLPLKSVAGALLFSVILGPVGLLYASTIGGAVMIFLSFTVISHQFYASAILLWLISCVWSVAAVNHYNKKNLRQ